MGKGGRRWGRIFSKLTFVKISVSEPIAGYFFVRQLIQELVSNCKILAVFLFVVKLNCLYRHERVCLPNYLGWGVGGGAESEEK